MNPFFVALGGVCFDSRCDEFSDQDLHWFCGKRTLIYGAVYMCLNEGVGSKSASTLPMWFCILGYIGTGV